MANLILKSNVACFRLVPRKGNPEWAACSLGTDRGWNRNIVFEQAWLWRREIIGFSIYKILERPRFYEHTSVNAATLAAATFGPLKCFRAKRQLSMRRHVRLKRKSTMKTTAPDLTPELLEHPTHLTDHGFSSYTDTTQCFCVEKMINCFHLVSVSRSRLQGLWWSVPLPTFVTSNHLIFLAPALPAHCWWL